MCKILMAPFGKSKELRKLLVHASLELSSTEKDGVGYAAIDDKGYLVSERWLRPSDAFRFRGPANDAELKFLRRARAAIEPIGYARLGDINTTLTGIMVHARTATSEKTIENTHPHIGLDMALIHNGVIDRDTQARFPQRNSTCDSESLLKAYSALDVMRDPKRIQLFSDNVEGYFAMGVLIKSEQGWLMDIVKDQKANLFYRWSIELEGPVYCTSAESLRQIWQALKWKSTRISRVLDCVLVRFDVHGQQVVTVERFKREYKASYAVARDADRAFGSAYYSSSYNPGAYHGMAAMPSLSVINDDIPSEEFVQSEILEDLKKGKKE